MRLRRLPADEAAVRRWVEQLWLPYHRELERTVEDHALADGIDLVAEELSFRLDRLAGTDHRAWIAVDGADGGPLAETDAEFAGFVTTDIDESPPVFDRPDRLVIGDVYVREPYRGTGLADELLDRAARRARSVDCPELALGVDADNGRALAFYDRLGFETRRHRMMVSTAALAERDRR